MDRSPRDIHRKKNCNTDKNKNQGQFLLTQYIKFASKTGTLTNQKKRGYWNGINNLSEMWGNNQ